MGKCNFQAISAQAGSPQRCHSRGSEAGSDALQAPLNPLQAQGGWMVTLWPCLTPQPALQMQEGPCMRLQENSDAKVLPCLKLSPKHKASKINPGFSSAGFPWLAQTLSTDLFPSKRSLCRQEFCWGQNIPIRAEFPVKWCISSAAPALPSLSQPLSTLLHESRILGMNRAEGRQWQHRAR